jgi:hypothetical protein
MDWKKIVDMPDGAERDRELANALKQLPYLEDEPRRAETHRLIEAEYSLGEEDLQALTMSRLRALLSLDDAGAARIAETYEDVMNSMTGEIAFRHAAVVQTIARHQFSVEEEARLKALMPNVFGEKPAEVSVGTPGPQEPAEPYPEKRWSFFWRRKKAEGRETAEIISRGGES